MSIPRYPMKGWTWPQWEDWIEMKRDAADRLAGLIEGVQAADGPITLSADRAFALWDWRDDPSGYDGASYLEDITEGERDVIAGVIRRDLVGRQVAFKHVHYPAGAVHPEKHGVHWLTEAGDGRVVDDDMLAAHLRAWLNIIADKERSP